MFENVIPCLEGIELPLRLHPLKGKYYGTVVEDASGNKVTHFWTAVGKPSSREIENFGPDFTMEAWRDYCCDSHWECETDLYLATVLVLNVNAASRKEEEK